MGLTPILHSLILLCTSVFLSGSIMLAAQTANRVRHMGRIYCHHRFAGKILCHLLSDRYFDLRLLHDRMYLIGNGSKLKHSFHADFVDHFTDRLVHLLTRSGGTLFALL